MFSGGVHTICEFTMTGSHVIREVPIMDAHVAARMVNRAIGTCTCGVGVKSATDSAQAGYPSCNSRVWVRHCCEYSLWPRG